MEKYIFLSEVCAENGRVILNCFLINFVLSIYTLVGLFNPLEYIALPRK